MNRNQKHAKNRPVQQHESITTFMANMDKLLHMAETVLTLHREQPTDTEAQLEGWMLVEELCRVTAVQARNLQTLLEHHGQELTLCDHCDLYHCPGDDHHEADHDHDDEPLAS
jgi:hypothetical protein